MAYPLLMESVNPSPDNGDPGRCEIDVLCRRILAYLERHPRAGDTVEGVTQWWLLEEEIRIESLRVQEALDRLVASQKVTATQQVDGRVFYQLVAG